MLITYAKDCLIKVFFCLDEVKIAEMAVLFLKTELLDVEKVSFSEMPGYLPDSSYTNTYPSYEALWAIE